MAPEQGQDPDSIPPSGLYYVGPTRIPTVSQVVADPDRAAPSPGQVGAPPPGQVGAPLQPAVRMDVLKILHSLGHRVPGRTP